MLCNSRLSNFYSIFLKVHIFLNMLLCASEITEAHCLCSVCYTFWCDISWFSLYTHARTLHTFFTRPAHLWSANHWSLILFTFGQYMHERYIFDALFLLYWLNCDASGWVALLLVELRCFWLSCVASGWVDSFF